MPTLYVDLMSQPSRACFILCKLCASIPVDIKLLRLDKGEHRKADYLKLNPLGKVPFLVDDDLHLPESAAIMAYLADKYSLPDAWHPPTAAAAAAGPGSSSGSSSTAARVAKQRALYESAVHWQHLTVRMGCTRLVFHTVIGPRVFKVPVSPEVAAHGLAVLQQSLKDLETCWLAGRPFMTGPQVSVPDLLCCCELEQLRLMVAEPSSPQLDQLLAPHPAVKAWMAAVRQAVGPQLYDAAHDKIATAQQRFAAAAKPSSRL